MEVSLVRDEGFLSSVARGGGLFFEEDFLFCERTAKLVERSAVFLEAKFFTTFFFWNFRVLRSVLVDPFEDPVFCGFFVLI